MLNIDEIKPKIAKLAEKYGLSLVVLFGSQATGKTHIGSDTDIAFSVERNMSLTEIAKMQENFSLELRIKDLEIVALNGAHPLLMQQVAKNGVVLYEKEHSLFSLFKIYAIKRFMEARALFDLRDLSLSRFLQTI